MKGRVLFHVQNLLGVGHLKRAEALALAMQDEGLDLTVALGGVVPAEAPFAGVRIAQLPPAHIRGDDFSVLFDEFGAPVDEAWKAHRRRALLDLFHRTDPDVVMIELFPFGRRQFAFELIPLLEAAQAREPRPRIVCSVRDVLVASGKPGRAEAIAATARHFFDAVLVHGDPDLIPLSATFPAAAGIEHLIRYTGYVVGAATGGRTAEGDGEVLVSAGGGAVGAPLLDAALAARPHTSVGNAVWRLLTGPNLPEADFVRLQARQDARTVVERYRADFAARLARCRLSISQAGYNTTLDILAAGARAVVVPYETASETEQRMRSELLAERGLLTVLPAAELSPATLADAIEAAIRLPGARPAGIKLDGARASARLVAEFAGRRDRAG